MYNEYQELRMKQILKSTFRKQYNLIPKEYKQNYYFEKFMFNLADIYNRILIAKEYNLQNSLTCTIDFKTSPKTTSIEYSSYLQEYTDKRKMELTLEENGTIHFVWNFAFVSNLTHKRVYNSNEDDVIYELTMKQDDDKNYVFVKHTIYSNKYNQPKKSVLYSMFDNSINEICRISESYDLNTNNIVSHEEFIPVGNVTSEDLKKFKEKAEQNHIQLLGIFGEDIILKEQVYHQDIKEVYVAKCTMNNKTRYAICWKSDRFVNKAYGACFDSVSEFGNYNNLFHTLDQNENPWLVEISQEEYEYFIQNSKRKITPDIKKLIK